MNIENGRYEVYYQFWPEWFGTDRPRQLSGKEIIELSHQWHLPLDLLLDQVFIISYGVIDNSNYTPGLQGGWIKKPKHFNNYVPKYCQTMLEKRTEEYKGNIRLYDIDQAKGVYGSVYRVYARPVQGYRNAFVKRINRWIEFINFKTGDGQADGYPAKLILLQQKQYSKKDNLNHVEDHALVQVPKLFAEIMVEDGYFPDEMEKFNSQMTTTFPRTWYKDVKKKTRTDTYERIKREEEADRKREQKYQELKRQGKTTRHWLSDEAKKFEPRSINVIY